jgi:hypothetical protein
MSWLAISRQRDFEKKKEKEKKERDVFHQNNKQGP